MNERTGTRNVGNCKVTYFFCACAVAILKPSHKFKVVYKFISALRHARIKYCGKMPLTGNCVKFRPKHNHNKVVK